MSPEPTTPDPVIALADVLEAAEVLAGVAQRTPVLDSRQLTEMAGGPVGLKAECFQRTGSFKFRGAYRALARLAEAGVERVVTYSSGNHGQAVAAAAGLLGLSATVVAPEDAPAIKVAAMEGYGATLVRYDRYSGDRAAIAAELAAESGALVVPPFDHPDVMAGQGTVALELVEQVAAPATLVVCVGGGGLMAGCATVAAARWPDTRIVGVEPASGDDHRRSLAAGRRVEIPVPRTIADGLQVTAPGELTWSVNSRLVDEVVTVDDAEIARAMRWAATRLKLVLEPSGAVGLAAVLAGRIEAPATVVLSGGNVDPARFAELIS